MAVASLVAAVFVVFPGGIVFCCLVDVVGTAKQHGPRAVGVAQPKGFQLVAPVAALRGSGARLYVGCSANAVFTFQHHVHRVLLLVLVGDAEVLVLWGLLVVHLHVLHREVGQVFEHNLVLALEEVGAIQRQVLHLLAVDEDFAGLRQLDAGQLLDESVEHGAFGHVEGVGIID